MKSGGFIEYFSQPKFIVGNRAMEHIPVELDGYSAKRPIVITDKKTVGKRRIDSFVTALYESNVVIGALFDEIPGGGSRIDVIERLNGLYRWRECDSIIAIGGGPVMDTAKALNVAVSRGFDFRKGTGSLQIDSSMVPLLYIAAPSYDGLECSSAAGIEGGSFTSEFLYPDLVCIDRRMAAPGRSSAASFVYSALDSLTRCIEGSAESDDNPLLDAASYAAIQLISGNIVKSAKKPDNKDAAVAVANGIAVAGSVRSNSKGGAVTFLSRLLADETGYPAGMISGILLTHALDIRIKKKLNFRDDLLLALEGIENYCIVPLKERPREAVRTIESITAALPDYFPSSLKEMKVQEYLLEKTAARAAEAGDKNITSEMCADILRSAWTEKQGGM